MNTDIDMIDSFEQWKIVQVFNLHLEKINSNFIEWVDKFFSLNICFVVYVRSLQFKEVLEQWVKITATL